MKKRYIVSALGILGVGAATYMMRNRENEQEEVDTLKQAGIPDQVEKLDVAQLENAKMVSEGSQFGVQYYNDIANDPTQS